MQRAKARICTNIHVARKRGTIRRANQAYFDSAKLDNAAKNEVKQYKKLMKYEK